MITFDNTLIILILFPKRSGQYNTDLAKAVNCPIIHVNGDYPELAYKAGQLAVKYRNLFAKDILVDITCFRYEFLTDL
jgi:2-oxoglutarate dehydrogenase complex dehydrogenase (E1) component-like enzyme